MGQQMDFPGKCVCVCRLPATPPCHQSQQGAIAFSHEVLTADPLYVNCPSTPFPQNQQEVFAFSCEVSTVALLYVNCWYAHHNSGSTKGNCLFTQSVDCRSSPCFLNCQSSPPLSGAMIHTFDLILVCQYWVATVSISDNWFGKNKDCILLTKFINGIDNTLHYKSQVEQSIQMSYSNQALY